MNLMGPVKRVNHTSWVVVVTPTDRPKSVRNHCVIELFVALFVLSLCPFDVFAGVGAFVIELSQISSLFSKRYDSFNNFTIKEISERNFDFGKPLYCKNMILRVIHHAYCNSILAGWTLSKILIQQCVWTLDKILFKNLRF